MFLLTSFKSATGPQSLLIFHSHLILEQPISTIELLVETQSVGMYRDVMRPRHFGIYNSLPFGHFAFLVSRSLVLQILCPGADPSALRCNQLSLPGVTISWAPSPNSALLPTHRQYSELAWQGLCCYRHKNYNP